MRLLAWLVLALLVMYALRKKAGAAMRPPPSSRQPGPAPGIDGETMVSCAHCGIYIPSSEAVHGAHDTVFCSTEHRALHAGS